MDELDELLATSTFDHPAPTDEHDPDMSAHSRNDLVHQAGAKPPTRLLSVVDKPLPAPPVPPPGVTDKPLPDLPEEFALPVLPQDIYVAELTPVGITLDTAVMISVSTSALWTTRQQHARLVLYGGRRCGAITTVVNREPKPDVESAE